MEEENKKEIMVLGGNIVTPTKVSKEEAYKVANNQQQERLRIEEELKREDEEIEKLEDSVATPIKVEKKINMEMVNQVNDLAAKEKEEYVRIVEMQHSPKTYLIMILILGLIVAIIVFEIIYYASK